MNPNCIRTWKEALTAYFKYYPSITFKEDIISKNVLLNTAGLKGQVRIRLFDIVKITFS
jgi:hypothetical protein